jgi:hypothetical protein
MLALLLVSALYALTPTSDGSASGSDLVITCPETGKFFCGSDYGPDNAGTATAVSTCDPAPVITFQDIDAPDALCKTDRFQRIVQRVWTATDSCGNIASCTQEIHIVRQQWQFDFHTRSCPNPVTRGGTGGVIPAAILGGPNQDASLIDPSTIQIWTEHCDGGPLSPIWTNLSDVSSPYTGGERCGCSLGAPDGYADLQMRFSRPALVQALNLNQYPNMTMVRLIITATTYDGCEIMGTDCARVQ